MTRARTACAVLLLLAAGPSALGERAEVPSGYSDEGANACIDCHESPGVMGILETVHAEESDSRTPMAQKQCQSCHGPSAIHMQFPMQVSNLLFGKESKTPAEVQNQMCLECHSDGDRKDWKASAHGFENVCSECHSIHDPDRIVPREATLSSGCSIEGCHDKLMNGAEPEQFTHATGKELDDQGELTCAGCHNPHGPLDSSRCLDCHPDTLRVLDEQPEKAKRFHEVALRKETECIRCHKGIAHPISGLPTP